jgi:transcriptional activator of cad operon
MPKVANTIFQLGDLRVYPSLDEIRKDGVSIKLEPRTMRLLVCLAERPGQVVSVDELLDLVWKDVVVSPDSLYQAVATLRRALGDDAKEPTYIASVMRRGYRLVAPVSTWVDTLAPEPAVEPPVNRTDSIPLIEASPESHPQKPSPLCCGARHCAPAALASCRRDLWGDFGCHGGGYFIAEQFRRSELTNATAGQYSPSPVVSDPSVAVLPFLDLSENQDQGYFADGMAEEVINTLTKVPGLKVPARTSSFAYKGRNVDIRQVAKDLGVRTILEGSVREAGQRIRITAQLINAQDGLHLWSETYDEQFTDLFKLQDELATQIAAALQPNLGGAAADAVRQAPPTRDVEAYRLYLQAASLMDRISIANVSRALELLEQAVTRDPKFARAYGLMADAHYNAFTNVNLPSEHLVQAEQIAVLTAMSRLASPPYRHRSYWNYNVRAAHNRSSHRVQRFEFRVSWVRTGLHL